MKIIKKKVIKRGRQFKLHTVYFFNKGKFAKRESLGEKVPRINTVEYYKLKKQNGKITWNMNKVKKTCR